jgi:hypothetical protein
MLHPNEVLFDRSKCTLLLHINKEDLKERCELLQDEANNRHLQLKKEFHITAIGFGNGKLLQECFVRFTPEERSYSEAELRELIQESAWNFSFGDDAYFLTKEYASRKDSDNSEVRTSIIQMVEMTGLAPFYKKLNELFGINLGTPPTHLTLYTGGSDSVKSLMGIGVETDEALQELNPIKITV